MDPTDGSRTAWSTAETDQTADNALDPRLNTSTPSAFQPQYNTQQLPAFLEPPVNLSGPAPPWRPRAANASSQPHDFDLHAYSPPASTGTQWSAGQAHSSFQGSAGFAAGAINTRGEQSQLGQTYHPNQPIILPRLAGVPFTIQQSDLYSAGQTGMQDEVPVEDGLSVRLSPDFQETRVWSTTAQGVAGPSGVHLGGTQTALHHELGDSGATSGPGGGDLGADFICYTTVACSRCTRQQKRCDRVLPKCGSCRASGSKCGYSRVTTKWVYSHTGDLQSGSWRAI